MTLPHERKRALEYTIDFLYALLDPKATPRVPKAVRQWARRVLRHYPHKFEIKEMAKKCPNLLGDENV